jgi:S1-C subfamily serine protease/rhodanese-related sulfurtransferase
MSLRLAATLGALLLTPTLVAAQDTRLQETLLRAKPAVALVVSEVAAEITLKCAEGDEITAKAAPYRETATGFLVNPRGWVITNAHVVAAGYTPPAWMGRQLAEKAFRAECLPALLGRRGVTPGTQPELEDQLARQGVAALAPDKIKLAPAVWVILPSGKRLPATVAKYSPPVAGEAMSGRDLALLRVEAADLPTIPLGQSRELNIGDRLSIIGFPGVVMTHELIDATKVEASVTHGTVSGFKQDRANQPVIQTDAAAEAGTSGGPAINTAGEVIGVLTFVTQAEGGNVQGFNFIIPAAAVRQFLDGTTVALDEPSRFNAAWQAGLHAFFNGQYSRATPHLTEANRLLPNVPDVRRISGENAARAVTQPLLPWDQVGIGLIVASLVGYAALFGRRWQRNRYRIGPYEVARLLDGNDPPAILDVRLDGAYDQSPVRIPRSTRVNPGEFDDKAPDIDRSRTIVAYCSCPDEMTSARVAHRLNDLGYAKVRILKGGLASWANAGLPLERKT